MAWKGWWSPKFRVKSSGRGDPSLAGFWTTNAKPCAFYEWSYVLLWYYHFFYELKHQAYGASTQRRPSACQFSFMGEFVLGDLWIRIWYQLVAIVTLPDAAVTSRFHIGRDRISSSALRVFVRLPADFMQISSHLITRPSSVLPWSKICRRHEETRRSEFPHSPVECSERSRFRFSCYIGSAVTVIGSSDLLPRSESGAACDDGQTFFLSLEPFAPVRSDEHTRQK
jgi:hypothetical protein